MDTAEKAPLISSGDPVIAGIIAFSPQGNISFPPPGAPIHIALAKSSMIGDSLVITEKREGKALYDLMLVNRFTGRIRPIQAPVNETSE